MARTRRACTWWPRQASQLQSCRSTTASRARRPTASQSMRMPRWLCDPSQRLLSPQPLQRTLPWGARVQCLPVCMMTARPMTMHGATSATTMAIMMMRAAALRTAVQAPLPLPVAVQVSQSLSQPSPWAAAVAAVVAAAVAVQLRKSCESSRCCRPRQFATSPTSHARRSRRCVPPAAQATGLQALAQHHRARLAAAGARLC